MKVLLSVEIVHTPERPESFVIFEKEMFLDFLPTEGLTFHLVEVPSWSTPYEAAVQNVQIFLTGTHCTKNNEPLVCLTFEPYDWKEQGQIMERWTEAKKAFIKDGWRINMPPEKE